MKRLRLWLSNFFKFKNILTLDTSESLMPSLFFLRENLIEKSHTLNRAFRKQKDYQDLEKLQDYSRIIEIINEIEDDKFLENVGFRFVDSSKYEGVVEIQDELFYQYETPPISEKERNKNQKLIEKSIILEKREWSELKTLLKKIIDESGI